MADSEAQWLLHFQVVIDTWGTRSDKNINSGTTLSCHAVCMGSPVLIMLLNKYQLGIIEIKSRETREVVYTCRYTIGHLIPNSVMGIGRSRD